MNGLQIETGEGLLFKCLLNFSTINNNNYDLHSSEHKRKKNLFLMSV